MIYLDSSVLLAELWAEPTRPRPSLWSENLTTSRLTHYEVRVRLHAARASHELLAEADELWAGVEWLELQPHIIARALDPFPKLTILRTLDALHLASADYLRSHGGAVEIATYDHRFAAAAQALGFPLAAL